MAVVFPGGNRQSYLSTAIKLAEGWGRRGHGELSAVGAEPVSDSRRRRDGRGAIPAGQPRSTTSIPTGSAPWGSAGGTQALFLAVTPGAAEFEGSGPDRDFLQPRAVRGRPDGVSNFTQSYSKNVNPAVVLPMFLGLISTIIEPSTRATPLSWVTPKAAPVLAIPGTNDNYGAYEQSLWIVERMTAAGAPAELKTIGDGDIVAMESLSGKTVWTKPNASSHDVQALSEGGALHGESAEDRRRARCEARRV